MNISIGASRNNAGLYMGYVAIGGEPYPVQKFYTGKSRDTRQAAEADARGLQPEIEGQQIEPPEQLTIEQIMERIPF